MTAEQRAPYGATPVVVLCLGGLLASMTQTMILPIQTELPRLIDSSREEAAWVVTITLLVSAASMPVAGRLADMLGKQRVFVASTLVLAVGSLICALSQGLPALLVGRALQGVSMSLVPVGISLIREICHPRAAATGIAAMSATMGIGGAVALPLAAWIAQAGDWRLMFWVTGGLAAVVLVLTVRMVPHRRPALRGSFDAPGALMLSLGLVAVLIGVSRATAWGWGDIRTLGSIALGIGVLLAWGWYELRQDEPLVDLHTSATPAVLLTNLAAVAVGFGMMAHAVVVPQLLQLPKSTGFGLGESLLASGLWMAPGGLVMLLFAPVSGRIIRNVGPKPALVLGIVVLGAGYVVALVLTDAPWHLTLVQSVASAGVGITFAAMPTLILDVAPPQEAAAAVGLNGLMRAIGMALASAVMGTVLTAGAAEPGGVALPGESAFELCFIIGLAVALIALLLALCIPHGLGTRRQ